MNGQNRHFKFFLVFALISLVSFLAVNWLQKEKIPYSSSTATAQINSEELKKPDQQNAGEYFSSSSKDTSFPFSTDAMAAMSVAVPSGAGKGEIKILFEKDQNKKLPIASLTKLMTAAIVLENYSLEDQMAINQQAAGASSMSLDFSGQKFTVGDVLRIMLIESNNEAASSLAEKMGKEKFIRLMNDKAAELKMDSTQFVNPNGLDEYNSSSNTSSALDLSKLVVYIEKNLPLVGQILSNKKFTVVSSSGRSYNLVNTNVLLYDRQTAWGKTGYTKKANGCIINIIEPLSGNEYAIINIVLGADDRFYEAQKLTDWINNYSILKNDHL